MIGQALKQTEIKAMTLLPTATTVNDLRNLVRFLKRKPEGISPLEITDIFRRRLFEPCKLMAYQTWGIISQNNNLICLSPLGWKLAEGLDCEAKQYRIVLGEIEPYRKALERIAESEMNLITYLEVINFWNENYPEVFPARDKKTGENCVISFFHLCHSAELGVAAVGRKGQPTRLTVDEEELKNFLNNSSENNFYQTPFAAKNGHHPNSFSQNNSAKPKEMRLLVSCGQKADFSASLREVLEITDVQYDVQIRAEVDMLLSAQTHKAMQECTAAIIIADEKNQVLCGGNYRFNDRLLSEIVASYALFETRVLLLWRGAALSQIPFTGLQIADLPDELDWRTGIDLGRRINEFKYQSV